MTQKQQAGFSLLEMMVALAILLIVTGIVMSGMVQMLNSQALIANRTEMHTSVRSATELLQQEIGQAGKVSLGDPNASVTLHAAVAATGTAVSFSVDTSSGATPSIYPGEQLTFDLGNNQETVAVTGTSSSPTGTFTVAHAAGTPVFSLGAFATGIIPPAAAPASYTNGSTDTVLKMYGDINSDGNMEYIEYTCAPGTATAPGTLSRNSMSITAASKPAIDNTMILLNNILSNPPSNSPVPCFQYQVQQLGAGYVVTNVAVTLTAQTQVRDPQTGQFQPETKALLNVSPRNVFEVWDTARLTDPTRAQAIPASVTNLLQ